MSLKIIDKETREELADLGMDVVDDSPAKPLRPRPHICRECQFSRREPHLGDHPEYDRCVVHGMRNCVGINISGSCEKFDVLPRFAATHEASMRQIAARHSSAIHVHESGRSNWIACAALGTSIAALAFALFGGCAFPEEGIPSEDPPPRWPWKVDAAEESSGSTGGVASASEGGGIASSGHESAVGSSDAEGSTSLAGSSESSSTDDVEGETGPWESSSTGEPPDPWGPCGGAKCPDGLHCAPSFSPSCGTTSSCHICSPTCDDDADCGDGAWCFAQLGFCMLACDGGCPDGAICVDDGADDFCSHPDEP